MAGMDYVNCKECGKRLFYDGLMIARDSMEETESTKGVTCSHCVKKLKKKLETALKFDRRR